MSEFIACLSHPSRPGRIELIGARHDPRLERGEGFDLLRARGFPTLEWTLPVVDRKAALRSLNDTFAGSRCGEDTFNCQPMDMRSEAIRLTTLRARPEPQKSLLGMLGLRRRIA
jgi:hypothetical protein